MRLAGSKIIKNKKMNNNIKQGRQLFFSFASKT